MKPRALAVSQLFLFLLPVVIPAPVEEAQPVVKVTGGEIVGRVIEQPESLLSKYYSFEGIPYARPPVGKWRFKDPEEVEPWAGIKNATAPGSVCVQKDIVSDKISGDEDCLFINVFTADPPSSWTQVKRPVLVFVHGGAFIIGSGNLEKMRADTLLRQEVIVVSFNYRLGILGFLSTRDNEAPGNAALKDSLLALRWVKKNIRTFGGDPDKVIIFGVSAGASMVHYLTLTPLTKGLIHGAMAMSGDALSNWALSRNPRRDALAIRQFFAALCPKDSPDAVVPCLQRIDAKDLVGNHDKSAPKEVQNRFWKNPFLPCVEFPVEGSTPFITATPEQIMREGRFNRVPFIMGYTNAEGIMYLRFAKLFEDPSLWNNMDDEFAEKFREEMPLGLRSDEAILQLRKYYMGDHSVRNANDDPEALQRFVHMVTDITFAVNAVTSARLMTASGGAVYVYEFTHEGPEPGWLKKYLYNATHVPGVAHADDLGYLFDFALRPGAQPITLRPEEQAYRERRVRTLTDFAKTGNPTPEGSELPTWPLYTPDKESYMEMGSTFTVKDHVLGEPLTKWRQLAKCQGAEDSEEHPVVSIAQGDLQGRRQLSAAGCSYYSFQGIPYARPPVGPLRFKDSQPPEPWKGVRNALVEGSVCPQLKWGEFDKVYGEEDCLFANVYTPRRPSSIEDPLPVLVWIHGGGFVMGSGDSTETGPDYLVCEDIILVTSNYRLGPFGFLHLDYAAPGNAGLKDQVMMLRWVQRNVAAFGGDPNRVTLAGESAGSGSVHFQMLSPLTKGMFQRAIAQSGTAINPWAIQEKPSESARILAQTVGCNESDSFAVVECLRGTSIDDLLHADINNGSKDWEYDDLLLFRFLPTNDLSVPGVENFLPEPPLRLVTEGSYHSVPLLVGFTTRERLGDMDRVDFQNESVARTLDEDWETKIFPKLRLPSNSSRKAEALKELRKFYMDGKPFGNETILGYIDMLSDIFFGEGIFYTIRHMSAADKVALYVYSFNVDDKLNANKIFSNMTNVPGAAHADDLGYIFHMSVLPEVNENSTAALTRRQMVRMWTNYVKTGDPTPEEDPLLGSDWKPYTKQTHAFLEIGEELTPGTNFYQERMSFWEKFYHTYSVK